MKIIPETCHRCQGWVWHRSTPCNCKQSVVGRVSHEDYMVAVGRRVTACRKCAGMTLDSLAARVPMSKTGLWQIEKGRSEPKASTIRGLAIAMHVTADYLLFADDES